MKRFGWVFFILSSCAYGMEFGEFRYLEYEWWRVPVMRMRPPSIDCVIVHKACFDKLVETRKRYKRMVCHRRQYARMYRSAHRAAAQNVPSCSLAQRFFQWLRTHMSCRRAPSAAELEQEDLYDRFEELWCSYQSVMQKNALDHDKYGRSCEEYRIKLMEAYAMRV